MRGEENKEGRKEWDEDLGKERRFRKEVGEATENLNRVETQKQGISGRQWAAVE